MKTNKLAHQKKLKVGVGLFRRHKALIEPAATVEGLHTERTRAVQLVNVARKPQSSAF
jgi:hypothetical protein